MADSTTIYDESGAPLCTINGSVSQAHSGDAGLDVYYMGSVPIVLGSLDRYGFPTGITVEIHNPEYYVSVRPRSGLSFNHGVTVLNAPGTVDAGYTGEVKVCLVNLSKEEYTVHPGDKIAQLVIDRNYIGDTHHVSSDGRGDSGFGDSGR